MDVFVISNLTSLRISPFFCVDISRLWISLISVCCPSSAGCSRSMAFTPVKNNTPRSLFQTDKTFSEKRGIFTFLKLMS